MTETLDDRLRELQGTLDDRLSWMPLGIGMTTSGAAQTKRRGGRRSSWFDAGTHRSLDHLPTSTAASEATSEESLPAQQHSKQGHCSSFCTPGEAAPEERLASQRSSTISRL